MATEPGDGAATKKRRRRDAKKKSRRLEDAAKVMALDDRLSGPRALLAVAALVACVGVALVGIGPSELGATLVLAGLVGLIAGVHFVGRMGPA
jgi:fatty acid desaturase